MYSSLRDLLNYQFLTNSSWTYDFRKCVQSPSIQSLFNIYNNITNASIRFHDFDIGEYLGSGYKKQLE